MLVLAMVLVSLVFRGIGVCVFGGDGGGVSCRCCVLLPRPSLVLMHLISEPRRNRLCTFWPDAFFWPKDCLMRYQVSYVLLSRGFSLIVSLVILVEVEGCFHLLKQFGVSRQFRQSPWFSRVAAARAGGESRSPHRVVGREATTNGAELHLSSGQ